MTVMLSTEPAVLAVGPLTRRWVAAAGLIGMGVDAYTGAAQDHKPNPLDVTLKPLAPEPVRPAKPRPAKRPPAQS